MTEYFYSDEVARLQVLLEEVTRAKPVSPETRFVRPESSTVDRLGSSFHHVLYGRRGTGKSSLLRHLEASHKATGRLVAWADQETYMGLSYPDVLVSTLADTFLQFADGIRSMVPPPAPKRFLRKAPPPDFRLSVAADLDQAVAQLIQLKHAPSESDIEWTATYGGKRSVGTESSAEINARKGHFGGSLAHKQSASQEHSSQNAFAHRFNATKAEHLEKATGTYRDLMKLVVSIAPDAFVVLDDFYRLNETDQPRIAGYLHRVVKDTSVWLKFGSIKYWTTLYAGGSPAVGLQVPHDIRELSLDRGLLDFNTSKRFLEQILQALAEECGVDIERVFSAGARDRLALASGGVPRDYIWLVSESIAVARNRGASKKSGTERVIAEDVNEAAGRTVEIKFSDLNVDAGGDATDLRDLVIEITNHCRGTGSACFLVDFADAELVAQLNRLQTMRFVHPIDDYETLPDQQSNRYNVFVLDVSQLAAQRAWQVDFMGWQKREKRRARKLVFTRQGAIAIPLPAEPPLQLDFDDNAAVVGEIDAAMIPPAV